MPANLLYLPDTYEAELSGGKAWTLVQSQFHDTAGHGTGGTCTSNTPNCNITVTSTGSGHLLVISAGTSASSITISSVSSTNNTWTLCGANCQANNSSGSVDMAYVVNSSSGDTSITVNLSASSGFILVTFEEYAWSGSSISFDTAGNITYASCTSCSGPNLTLAGSNEVMVSSQATANSSSVPGGCWTNPNNDASTVGCMNTALGTGAPWTQTPAGAAAVNQIAFKGS